MRANQSYLVANRNLVVEGADDYWIVTELSNTLQRSGDIGLPDDVMITAAGGASEVVHLSTFMVGQGLQVVALFDSDEAGRREEERLRTKWLTRYKTSRSATVLLGQATEVPDHFDCAIEDLFPEDYYLDKLRQSHSPKLEAIGKSQADLKFIGKGLLVSKAERACEAAGIQFNKGSVAKLIRKDLLMLSNNEGLPTGTAERANKLFAAIRKAFGD